MLSGLKLITSVKVEDCREAKKAAGVKALVLRKDLSILLESVWIGA